MAISELPATKLAMEAALEHPELVEAFLKRYARGCCCAFTSSSWIAITRRQGESSRASSDAGTISLVVIVGAGSAAQDRHDVPGRDRGRQDEG